MSGPRFCRVQVFYGSESESGPGFVVSQTNPDVFSIILLIQYGKFHCPLSIYRGLIFVGVYFR